MTRPTKVATRPLTGNAVKHLSADDADGTDEEFEQPKRLNSRRLGMLFSIRPHLRDLRHLRITSFFCNFTRVRSEKSFTALP